MPKAAKSKSGVAAPDSENFILTNVGDARALESLYRKDPRTFASMLVRARKQSDSAILDYWNERINFVDADDTSSLSRMSLLLTVLFALLAGTLAKLPDILQFVGFSFADVDGYYTRNAALFITPFIAAFFLLGKNMPLKHKLIPFGLFLLVALFANFALPYGDAYRDSDTLVLAFMHLPFLLLSIVGFSYALPNFNDPMKRVGFLKYLGEALIYTGILLICGMILAGMTMALFSVAGIDIAESYMEWVGVYGAVSAPIVATYLTRLRSGNERLAPLFAKVFAPLLLVTLVAYIVIAGINGANPFADREFLIAFNGMLLGVLAISTFVLTARKEGEFGKFQAFTSLGLISVSLVIDVIALMAMAFRLYSYGITPNRVAVLGVNVLIFVNLFWILYHHGRHVFSGAPSEKVSRWIGSYLPVYAAWSVFIVFVFPFIFGMK